MTEHVAAEDASQALAQVDRERRRVLAEINLPHWYWWGLAVGWVGLGVLADVGNALVSTIATLAFGAVHASVAPRVLDGRHRTQRLTVHRQVVSRRLPLAMTGALIVMVLVTIALALVLNADGARHPAAIAGVVVALLILAGGPPAFAAVSRRMITGSGPAR